MIYFPNDASTIPHTSLYNGARGALIGFLGSHLIHGVSEVGGAIFGGVFYGLIIPFNFFIAKTFKKNQVDPPLRLTFNITCASVMALTVTHVIGYPVSLFSGLLLAALIWVTSFVFLAIENCCCFRPERKA